MESPKQLPSVHDFYLNTALYSEFTVDNSESIISEVFDIIYNPKHLDCYCIDCQNNSVFKFSGASPKPENIYNRGSNYEITDGSQWMINLENIIAIYNTTFTCSRNPLHILTFTIYIKNKKISKVGQSTSFADLQEQTIKEYKKILGNDNYKEFSKAIGLYSHGIGAGAFVYLRRIIENFIIKPAYEQAKLNPNWKEDEYQKARVRDKIELLREGIPEFLVDNSVFYSVVSKGIHELTEEECKEYFPVLKAFLEEVLTDLEAKRKRDLKKSETQKALSNIANKISK